MIAIIFFIKQGLHSYCDRRLEVKSIEIRLTLDLQVSCEFVYDIFLWHVVFVE